jgi:N,N-dimethylformamidase beta subunit-like protein
MKIPIELHLYSSLAPGAARGGSPKSTVSAVVPQPVRGRVLGVLRRGGIFLCLMPVTGLLVSPAHGQASNPIVVENQQPGTSQWQIPFGSSATDAGGQIKGYASATSVNKGQNITFYVSVNPAQTYTIDVYRMGWYQGLGGRLMQHIGPLSGIQQPTCPTDATTGMIECQWAPAYTLATQTSWTSGIYLALLTNAQGYQNYIVFVVRDDSRVAALLYQQPVTTYQAYNDYPYDNTTGKSLYPFNSYGATTVSGGTNAVKVSFDRPYLGDGTGVGWGQTFFSWEFAFVRWMEKSGYDVTYATDVDTHTNGSMLLNYRGILSVGHDEYFSKPMYDAFIAARDAGVNLGFFGANAIYWQVRFEPSSSGAPNRVLVCYRNASLDPNTDPTLKTVNWRDSQLNRPEQTLAGVQYTNQTAYSSQTGGYYPYVVTNSGNWVYAGTGFKDGDNLPHMVGYEADRLFGQYPSPNAVSGTYTLLSNSPFTIGSGTDYSNSSVYQAPSGAWVFATGTFGWSYALDNFNGNNVVDPRIQQTTANVLNAFLTGVAPTITSFTPASGGVGSSVAINGTNFIGAASVAFNGSAASFTVTSATAIQATVPAGATTGPLSVTAPGGTATSTNNFIVIPAPTIASFAPTSGPVGTSVAISGANFTGATAVTFNGSAASFTVTSDTAIQATAPAGAMTGPISVTTPGGTAASTNNFIVIPAPTITIFTPICGRAGTSVAISGANFTGATVVTFNGRAASFTVTSDTAIQATVPVGATTGPISVTTPGGTALTANNFTVKVPLTVTKTGLIAGGTVTSSPTGIDCGSTCSADFSTGTVVTLTAKPGLLSIFTGWNGCDAAKGTTCTVTMNAAKTVTANFLP